MATESTLDKSAPKAASTPKTAGKSYIPTVTMAIMIVTTVVSLRGLASQAEFGVSSMFYYIFAAVVFLIPFSLLVAELA